MKTNDEILKYLSGLLSEAEKERFEGELEKSPSLRSELEKVEAALGELKALGKVEIETHYFENLLPRLKEKMTPQKKKSFRLYPRLAYLIPVIAIAAFFLFKPFNPFHSSGSTQAEFTKAVSQMNDQTKTEILGSLLDNESSTIQIEQLPENAAEAVENKMGEELYQGSDSKAQYLDTDELINSVSNDEADRIYQNMINKKIL